MVQTAHNRHNWRYFFINDDGSGYLMMKGSDLYFRNTNNADMIHAHCRSKAISQWREKLATTSTGIDVGTARWMA